MSESNNQTAFNQQRQSQSDPNGQTVFNSQQDNIQNYQRLPPQVNQQVNPQMQQMQPQVNQQVNPQMQQMLPQVNQQMLPQVNPQINQQINQQMLPQVNPQVNQHISQQQLSPHISQQQLLQRNIQQSNFQDLQNHQQNQIKQYREDIHDKPQLTQNMRNYVRTFDSQMIEANLLKLKSKQIDTFLNFFLIKKPVYNKYLSEYEKYNISNQDIPSEWQKSGKDKAFTILKLFLNIDENSEWNMALFEFIEVYASENRNIEKILHKCYKFCDVAWQLKRLDKLIEILED